LRSPFEQAALNYCAPGHVPLSIFLGRVVNPGEPYWLESDQIAALEWQAEQNRRCVCGEDLDESTAPDAHDAYVVAGIRCHACAAIDRRARAIAGRDDIDPLAGMRYRFLTGEEDD